MALAPLRAAGRAAQDAAAPAAVRALLAMLVDEGGITPREAVAEALAALDRDQRRAVTRLGVRIGALDLFMPAVLKPEAMRWRAALRAAACGELMPDLPPDSSVVLPTPPELNVTFPGRVFAYAMSSRRSCAGIEAFETTTPGTVTAREIGTKSRSRS